MTPARIVDAAITESLTELRKKKSAALTNAKSDVALKKAQIDALEKEIETLEASVLSVTDEIKEIETRLEEMSRKK